MPAAADLLLDEKGPRASGDEPAAGALGIITDPESQPMTAVGVGWTLAALVTCSGVIRTSKVRRSGNPTDRGAFGMNLLCVTVARLDGSSGIMEVCQAASFHYEPVS